MEKQVFSQNEKLKIEKKGNEKKQVFSVKVKLNFEKNWEKQTFFNFSFWILKKKK